MRHRVSKYHLNRDTNHRKALIKNLVRQLVETGSVTTTRAKAKLLKQMADKTVAKAKTDSVATRRLLQQFFGRRDVVNTLVDRVAPAHPKRSSGFTTISEVGIRRGDNTKLFKVAFVNSYDTATKLKAPKASKPASKSKSKAAKATKTTKKTTAKKTETKKKTK